MEIGMNKPMLIEQIINEQLHIQKLSGFLDHQLIILDDNIELYRFERRHEYKRNSEFLW